MLRQLLGWLQSLRRTVGNPVCLSVLPEMPPAACAFLYSLQLTLMTLALQMPF